MSTIDHQPARPVTDSWDWQLFAACRGLDVKIAHGGKEPLRRADDESRQVVGPDPALPPIGIERGQGFEDAVRASRMMPT